MIIVNLYWPNGDVTRATISGSSIRAQMYYRDPFAREYPIRLARVGRVVFGTWQRYEPRDYMKLVLVARPLRGVWRW